jgi:hypothetical protein
MKGIIYGMGFQILVGIWLFISPFVMGFRELTNVAVNNMILGAVLVILGLGVSLSEFHHREELKGMERVERKSI